MAEPMKRKSLVWSTTYYVSLLIVALTFSMLSYQWISNGRRQALLSQDSSRLARLKLALDNYCEYYNTYPRALKKLDGGQTQTWREQIVPFILDQGVSQGPPSWRQVRSYFVAIRADLDIASTYAVADDSDGVIWDNDSGPLRIALIDIEHPPNGIGKDGILKLSEMRSIVTNSPSDGTAILFVTHGDMHGRIINGKVELFKPEQFLALTKN